MKRCPVCGERYEDVYTTCSDGSPLEADSDGSPLLAAPSKRIAPGEPVKRATPPVPPTKSAATTNAMIVRVVCLAVIVFAALFTIYIGKRRSNQTKASIATVATAPETPVDPQADGERVLQTTTVLSAIRMQTNFANAMQQAAAHAPGISKPMTDAVMRWVRTMEATTAQLEQAERYYSEGAKAEIGRPSELQIKRGLREKACNICDRQANVELRAQEDLRREMTQNHVPPESIARFFADEKVSRVYEALRQHGLALQRYAQNIRSLGGLMAMSFNRPTNSPAADAIQKTISSCQNAERDLMDAFSNSVTSTK